MFKFSAELPLSPPRRLLYVVGRMGGGKKKTRDAGEGSDGKRKEKKRGPFVPPIVHRALTIFV